VQPGDIITSLEQTPLAADGTMQAYCDILRSRSLSETLSLQVLRYAEQQPLIGQINGRALAVPFTAAANQGTAAAADTGYSDYRTVTDASGVLRVSVPLEWGEHTGHLWSEGDSILGVTIVAAPGIDQFYNSWNTPGLFLGVSRSRAASMDIETQLDQTDFSSNCTLQERGDYQAGRYSAMYDVWADCGGTPTDLYVVSFMPADGSFLGLAQVQVVSAADLEALDRIIGSLDIVGELP
jgi:serine protease Do